MAKQILVLLKRNDRVKRGRGLPMKRTVPFALTFLVTILIGMVGTSRLTAQQAAPNKTKGRSAKTVASSDFGPLSVATAAVNPPKIDRQQPSNKYMTNSAPIYDREKVEVLARSVTFPQVIKQGEYLLSVEFPNAEILCLDAAYYAGQVQGLIWAMDRETVEKQELYWIIDDATELFQSCLRILFQAAFIDQNTNGKFRLRNFKEELAEQLEIIQGELRKAQNVKIKGAGTAKGSESYSQRGMEKPGSGSD